MRCGRTTHLGKQPVAASCDLSELLCLGRRLGCGLGLCFIFKLDMGCICVPGPALISQPWPRPFIVLFVRFSFLFPYLLDAFRVFYAHPFPILTQLQADSESPCPLLSSFQSVSRVHSCFLRVSVYRKQRVTADTVPEQRFSSQTLHAVSQHPDDFSLRSSCAPVTILSSVVSDSLLLSTFA